MNLEVLLSKVKEKDFTVLDEIAKAYSYAEETHRGVTRKSGEPYIIHPFIVACTLADMGADKETIIAGLLHDVVEDTKENPVDVLFDIEDKFGSEVATLVDGVTKMPLTDFMSKEEQNNANLRKLLVSMTKDVRVLLIKMSDRLHNMQTIGSLRKAKRIENSMETLEKYTYLAQCFGMQKMKIQLADLAFQELAVETYIQTKNKLDKMYPDISKIALVVETLENANLSFHLRPQHKSIYDAAIATNIHPVNLQSLNIVVSGQRECYQAFSCLKQQVPYLYQEQSVASYFEKGFSLMMNQKDKEDLPLKINTEAMELFAEYGIAAFWQVTPYGKEKMQQYMKTTPVYKTLQSYEKGGLSDLEFVNRCESELFSKSFVTPQNAKVYQRTKRA